MTVRRSELTCPGHSASMMQKAAASAADEVIFDLEDACAPSQKVAARATVAEALRTCDFGGKVRAYRVNSVDTAYCYRDVLEVLEVAGACVDVVVVPKVQGPDDVKFVDRLITQVERSVGLPVGRIRLEVLIESAKGLLAAPAIATASPRLASLIFGVADYAGDVGARDFRDDHLSLFAWPRAQILAAARAAGLQAIDSVTVQFKDLALVERDAKASAHLGYDGKWAIHPAQLPIINAAYTPTAAELTRARRVVEAYAKAGQAGEGAIVVDDEMVDAATVVVERRKLEIAERDGVTAP